MEEALRAIIERIRQGEGVDSKWVESLLRSMSRDLHCNDGRIAKKHLLPFYLRERANDSDLWKSWNVDGDVDGKLVSLLRWKPRGSASGVATVTVLTRPWPCTGGCLYCPNDIRMPKSYMSDEPACQRAERCWFDPYLQVLSRLNVLSDMGHNTDKVELIVLGGTFSEYPKSYRIWFVEELFRALNDFGKGDADSLAEKRRSAYISCGLGNTPCEIASKLRLPQEKVNEGISSYNSEVARINSERPLALIELEHKASIDDLVSEHVKNETSECRNVGLVVETRPDLVTREHLRHLRELGCTKIQMGIQSLSPEVLKANARSSSVGSIVGAFELLREFGFKSHVHFMVNLLGSDPCEDKLGYEKLMSDERFRPDEVKLYPCALVESADLMARYEDGSWSPYGRAELVDILAFALKATPPYTRISRMVRDISSKDIVAGNKKANLRQMVEAHVDAKDVEEMRFRETGTEDAKICELSLDEVEYETSNTHEHFLQWVKGDGTLVAFLRLSLPKSQRRFAMIREVHVYGRVSRLHEQREGSQHAGLGRALTERACEIARRSGYGHIKVISAVGTRGYYRKLNFVDDDLYLTRRL